MSMDSSDFTEENLDKKIGPKKVPAKFQAGGASLCGEMGKEEGLEQYCKTKNGRCGSILWWNERKRGHRGP